MNGLLVLAAALSLLIGVIHSVLGERYILIRLFRRDNLPKLFGGDAFTKQTLRFAWHLTTVAWWGLGAVLFAAGSPAITDLRSAVLAIVAVVFLVSALTAAGASRGRHLAWIVFLAIAVLAWLAR